MLSSPLLSESPPSANYVRTISPILDNSSPLYSPQFVKQTQYLTKNVKHNQNSEDFNFTPVKTIHINKKEEFPTRVNLVNSEHSKKGILRNEKLVSNVLSSDSFKNELMQHVKRSKSPNFTVENTTTTSTTYNVKSPVLKSMSPSRKFERIQSPIDRSLSPMGSTYRISTSTSTYKTTERTSSPMLRHMSPTGSGNERRNSIDLEENIEKLSNIKSKKEINSVTSFLFTSFINFIFQ